MQDVGGALPFHPIDVQPPVAEILLEDDRSGLLEGVCRVLFTIPLMGADADIGKTDTSPAYE